MLLTSAVDIAIGWIWHTAYRARWHWKLNREWALFAAGCVALVGVIDSARSHGGGAQPASVPVMALAAPASVAAMAPAVDNVVKQAMAAIPVPAPSPQQPAPQAALAYGETPQFPIIQDQTGSIDPADPIETILPIDPEAQKDDPIAQKINERYGDAVEAAPKKKPVRAVKTASAKPAPAKPATKPKKPATSEAD